MENTSNTYTKISNAQLESWYTDLDYPLFIRVQFFIVRMTQGFHRTKFNTSRQKIAEAIGHGDRCLTLITRATNKLVKKGVISKNGSWITLNSNNQLGSKSYPQVTQPSPPKNQKSDLLDHPKVHTESPTIKKVLKKELTTSTRDRFLEFCSSIGLKADEQFIKLEYEKFLSSNEQNKYSRVVCDKTAFKYFHNWLKQCYVYQLNGVKQQLKPKKSQSPVQTKAPEKTDTLDNRFTMQNLSSNASKVSQDFARFTQSA